MEASCPLTPIPSSSPLSSVWSWLERTSSACFTTIWPWSAAPGQPWRAACPASRAP